MPTDDFHPVLHQSQQVEVEERGHLNNNMCLPTTKTPNTKHPRLIQDSDSLPIPHKSFRSGIFLFAAKIVDSFKPLKIS
jgi:hypothetical protein